MTTLTVRQTLLALAGVFIITIAVVSMTTPFNVTDLTQTSKCTVLENGTVQGGNAIPITINGRTFSSLDELEQYIRDNADNVEKSLAVFEEADLLVADGRVVECV